MASELIAGCLGKIGEFMVEISGRQLGYLIHYNRNIENLKEQVKTLEAKKQGVQLSIDAAKNNGEIIVPKVERWLENVGNIMDEAEKFLNDDVVNANNKCLCGWFPDLKSRHRLGRQAAQKEQRVTQLEKDGKFDPISYPAPPKVIEFLYSSGDFIAFDSTKSIMEKAMQALKEDKISFIGLYGMGGVGKTTLVKQIMKKAKEDCIFDKVVMVVVSQPVDLKKIQDQIAETLGSNLNELHSDAARASQLHAVLKNVKRLLVIFDDVWERLDVKAVGVPFGVDHNEGCKIIITSRREQVCKVMDKGDQTTKIIRLDTLSESESRALFITSVGSSVFDDDQIKEEADKVVRECRGLPVALVTVGRAMKGKDLKGWKVAVRDLEKSIPANLEGVEKEVFKCLKLSYDYLRDEESKSCFLLCSLFPEDHDIKIELLMRYGWGLGIFKNVDTIHEARDRAYSIFNNLKESCLLLEGRNKDFVKMHDVVRDVAISIGSEVYYVKAGVRLKEWPRVETGKHYSGISLMHHSIGNYPDAWDCPKLQILLMQSEDNYRRLEMPEGVYKGMKTLKVLDKSSTTIMQYLVPQIGQIGLKPSFFALSNLRTLILESLYLDNITTLGEMKTLEVLSLANSRLKDPITQLTNLRLLDLSSCRTDDKEHSLISSDVISSLARLEELYMSESDCEFGDCPKINELQSLHNLTILTTEIANIKCIPEDFVFPDTLETFSISINGDGDHIDSHNYLGINVSGDGDNIDSHNYLGINVSGDGDNIGSHNFIKPLLRKTNHLEFVCLNGFKNALPDLLIDGDGLNVLETLDFTGCKEVEYLIDATKSRMTQQRLLYELKKVSLSYLDNFKSICHGELPPGLCLLKLEKVYVKGCPSLTGSLASLELLQRLQKLDEIRIEWCGALENVFELEGAVFEDKKLLSNLTSIRLEHLPELKHIWIGPTERINLHNLQEVNLNKCNKLKFLFEPAIARRLPRLETLKVTSCDMLEVIVAADEQERVGNEAAEEKMVFPKLRNLHLKGLPNLNAFSMGNFSFEWPSLEEVFIGMCPKMKTFTCDEIQTTPKLRESRVDGVDELREGNRELNVEGVTVTGCPILTGSLASLELHNIHISYCEALENVFELEGAVFEDKKLLSNLTSIHLVWLPELKHIWIGPTERINLHNLQEVTLYECNKLKFLFEPAIAGRLPRLETLKVSSCDMLEVIVAADEQERVGNEAAEEKMVFPKLRDLHLEGLPNLNAFSMGNFSFEWPSLEAVFITKCPKMKTFTCDEIQTTPKLRESRVDGVDELREGNRELNVEGVTVTGCPILTGILASLELHYIHILGCEALENVFELEGAVFEDKKLLSNLTSIFLFNLPELKHIWIGPTERINLHNLQQVILVGCNKLKFLFEPAIARRLPRLETLTVRECDMLEVIVAADEEERVGNEAAEEKMVFPKLTSLRLEGLPNLNAFSTGNFSFEWPSLESVIVDCCPKMKTFTCDEIQTTPKLRYFRVDGVVELGDGNRELKNMMEAFMRDKIQTTPKLREFRVDGVDELREGNRELNVNMMIQKRYKEKESETTSRAEPIDVPQELETISSD